MAERLETGQWEGLRAVLDRERMPETTSETNVTTIAEIAFDEDMAEDHNAQPDSSDGTMPSTMPDFWILLSLVFILLCLGIWRGRTQPWGKS